MRCVLVAIGWENIALQALSAMLKKNGHEVHLVYDQALFDDKNYLSIPWMAKLFDQKEMINLSDYSKGIYIIQLINNDTIINHRLILQ